MAQIPMEEMHRFDRTARTEFHYKLMQYLRQQLVRETHTLDDPALLQRILEGEARAMKYGVRTDAGITQWVCLTFISPRFDEIPEVKEFLAAPEPEPDEKIAELVDALSEDMS